jgi:hypothetical protein
VCECVCECVCVCVCERMCAHHKSAQSAQPTHNRKHHLIGLNLWWTHNVDIIVIVVIGLVVVCVVVLVVVVIEGVEAVLCVCASAWWCLCVCLRVRLCVCGCLCACLGCVCLLVGSLCERVCEWVRPRRHQDQTHLCAHTLKEMQTHGRRLLRAHMIEHTHTAASQPCEQSVHTHLEVDECVAMQVPLRGQRTHDFHTTRTVADVCVQTVTHTVVLP